MIPRFIHEQLIDDCDILVEMFKRYEKIKAENNMELKEETEKLKPHSFCETPEEKCTLNYCDENGCMNRKRVLVKPELNVAYKETKQKLKKGDIVVCTTNYLNMFTKGKEYQITNIGIGYFNLIEDFGDDVSIPDNHIGVQFKLKEKKETAYKETEGKLFYELDFEFITQMAERMASNKKEGKYGLFNWMKPMSKTDLINLIQAQYRHAMDLMNFKFEDDSRPYGTLEAFSNNAMMINYQLKTYFKDYKFSKQDLLEIQVSPSTKINTTDSTGLLTEEK